MNLREKWWESFGLGSSDTGQSPVEGSYSWTR